MTLGSHQRTIGASQVHITPKWIIDRLGPFDMDPCAAWPRPWPCATQRNVSHEEDGLSVKWQGRIWLNPPFDRRVVGTWIKRMAEHGNGIALLHARTETAWFQPIWDGAMAILFMANRIKFCRPDGSEQPANSGAPAVLVAFSAIDELRLSQAKIAGALVRHWETDP